LCPDSVHISRPLNNTYGAYAKPHNWAWNTQWELTAATDRPESISIVYNYINSILNRKQLGRGEEREQWRGWIQLWYIWYILCYNVPPTHHHNNNIKKKSCKVLEKSLKNKRGSREGRRRARAKQRRDSQQDIRYLQCWQ
jgi:hypothetical protein